MGAALEGGAVQLGCYAESYISVAPVGVLNVNLANDSFVTVVSGLPRSGTSMMMHMLSSGGLPLLTDDARSADADNPQGYLEFAPVLRTRTDSTWVGAARGKAVKVIYGLLRDLPAEYTYRIVFMQRQLEEVVRSQQVMLERRGEPGAGLAPDKMIDLFARQVRETQIWLDQQPNVRVLYVPYADVVKEPPGEAQRVADFLALELDIAAMAEVVDATLYRQRKK